MTTQRIFIAVILASLTFTAQSQNDPNAPPIQHYHQFDSQDDQLAIESSDQPTYVRIGPDSDWSASIYNSQRPLPYQQHQKVLIGIQPGVSDGHRNQNPSISSSWNHKFHGFAQDVIGEKPKEKIDSSTVESLTTFSSPSPPLMTGPAPSEPKSTETSETKEASATNSKAPFKLETQNIVTILGRPSEVERNSKTTEKNENEKSYSEDAIKRPKSNSITDGDSDLSERIFTIIDNIDSDLQSDVVPRSEARIDLIDDSSNGVLANASFVELNGSNSTKPCSITIINYIYAKDAATASGERDPEIAIVDHVNKNQDEAVGVGRSHIKIKQFPKKGMQPKSSYIKRASSFNIENNREASTELKNREHQPKLSAQPKMVTSEANLTTTTYRAIPATSRDVQTTEKPALKPQIVSLSTTRIPSYTENVMQISGSESTTSSTRVAPPSGSFIDQRLITQHPRMIAPVQHQRPPPRNGAEQLPIHLQRPTLHNRVEQLPVQHLRPPPHNRVEQLPVHHQRPLPPPGRQVPAGNQHPDQQKEEYYTISSSQLSRLFASNFMRLNNLYSPGGPTRQEHQPGFGNTMSGSSPNRLQVPAPFLLERPPQSDFERDLAAGFEDGLRNVMRNEPEDHDDVRSFSEDFIMPAANTQTFQQLARPSINPQFNFRPPQQQQHQRRVPPLPWLWHRSQNIQPNRPREIHYVIGNNQESD